MGCVITHIYSESVLDKDGRVKIFDQILEINSVPLTCDKLTTFGVHQLFFTRYEKVSLLVFRAEPAEVEELKVDINRKQGKELGLGLTPNEHGCTITEIVRKVLCIRNNLRLFYGICRNLLVKWN